MTYLQLFSLPNILTLINLFSGCLGVVFLFNNKWELVPLCILVSLVADFFDGFAARFTKTNSDLGKQLDSLADVVSFGFLPGAILFNLIGTTTHDAPFDAKLWVAAPGFLVSLFAALRLAKFNIDTRQSDGFIGLATPAATLFIAGILLIHIYNPYNLADITNSAAFLYTTTVIVSFLMIAELPMFSFKFKSFGWKGNEIRYLFIILSVVLLATLKFAAVSVIIILYILISIAQKLFTK
ncbi:MAG: CDP-alcohol phosphatidyltransferase family protein [Bacteroidetes bacterium]|nr:CDP-alcohol phosphatidyltransferase family protein [Bacteroidota bacterium]